LHPFRDSVVRTGWPLLVDRMTSEEPWARSVGSLLRADLRLRETRALADNLGRLERCLAEQVGAAEAPAHAAVAAAAQRMVGEIELPPEEASSVLAAVAAMTAQWPEQAMLLPFGAGAAQRLLDLAGRRRLAAARCAILGTVHELAETLGALLEADRERRPAGVPAAERVEGMGAFASRFVDSGQLAGVVAKRNSGASFASARRARIEKARAVLLAFEGSGGEPSWLSARSQIEIGEEVRPEVVPDPCAAAIGAFDGAAAGVLILARALRVARLEVADSFDEAWHEPWLERFDWRGLSAEELALVPPVCVLARVKDVLPGQLDSLSRLLTSGRPAQVLLLADGLDGESEGLTARLEPGYLGMSHRECFVQQGSLAAPGGLAAGFAKALAGDRPALHVVDIPVSVTGSVDPYLAAAARVSGRAAPLFRFDPQAGSTWARRLRFTDNPEPAADWPREKLPESMVQNGAPEEVAFTFADAALLDPRWQAHFALVATAEAAAQDLTPFADWLALGAEDAARRLPFVWGAEEGGGVVRLVVTRELAAAARDRLGFWRTLEELAGVRNEYVEDATAAALAQAERRFASEREQVAARHAEALERVRADGDAAAVDRIVAALFEVEPQMAASAPRQAARQAPIAGPATGPATAPVSADGAPGPAAGEAEDVEAWVDTALCTSCDECTRKYPGIFVYNSNKQAYIKDARGGSYKDLVAAAELCTAKIIHPGTPWDASEPDLADLRERARRFA
jgi:ferredoxin